MQVVHIGDIIAEGFVYEKCVAQNADITAQYPQVQAVSHPDLHFLWLSAAFVRYRCFHRRLSALADF